MQWEGRHPYLMLMQMLMQMTASPEARYVRTTVKVREDLHAKAKRKGLDLSEALNEALAQRLTRPKGRQHPLLGVLREPGKGRKDWRKDWADVHADPGHEW
jgi:hypothetical protein